MKNNQHIPQEVHSMVQREELFRAANYLVWKCGYTPAKAMDIVYDLI